MKYTLTRLFLFLASILLVLVGQHVYSLFPGIEIALWIFAPIVSALIAWAFTSTIDAEVQEKVKQILDEASEESSKDDEQQTPE